MKRLLLVLALVLLPRVSQAQTMLADCNSSTIQTAYDAAVAAMEEIADLECPAGPFTWTATGVPNRLLDFVSNISLRLTGAGDGDTAADTVITDNVQDYAFQINAFPGRSYEISGFRFKSQNGVGYAGGISTGLIQSVTTGTDPAQWKISNFKFHDVTFDTCNQTTGNGRRSLRFINGAITGVIYDSTFLIGSRQSSAQLGINHEEWGGYTEGDGSWFLDVDQSSDEFLFVEDNVFERCPGITTVTTEPETEGGTRLVMRFNQWTNISGGAALHGTETSGRARGPRIIQNYYNAYTRTSSTAESSSLHRGGNLLAFGNVFTYMSPWGLRNNRSAANGLWRVSDGSSKFDLNDDTIYYQGINTGSSALVVTDLTASWTPSSSTTGGGWLSYSVRNCGPGLLTDDVFISNCARGIAYTKGSFVLSNTATTITLASGSPQSAQVNFQNGDVYLILRATKVIDAVGRGRGRLLSQNPAICASCPTDPDATSEDLWLQQIDEPTYFWNNLRCGGGAVAGCTPDTQALLATTDELFTNLTSAVTPHIRENRDVYNNVDLSSFDGTVGVSRGPKSVIESGGAAETCTAGVGYEATDEGDWNSNPDGVVGSSNPLLYAGQGVFYRCVYTNADADDPLAVPVGLGDETEWREYFEPLDYPHPLRNSNEPAASPTLLSISPTSGTRTNGTRAMTFTGTDFNGGSGFAVTISVCTGVTVGSASGTSDTTRTATFTISASADGVCGVVVATTAGTSASQSFTVTKPALTVIDPPAGNRGGGTDITLTGTTLSGATPVITISGTSITYSAPSCSATSCTSTLTVAADAIPGVRTINFSTFDGEADETLTFEVLSGEPILETITPATCYRGARCWTKFEGSGFTGNDLVKTCTDDVMELSSETVVSDTLITAYVIVPTDAFQSTCGFQVTSGGLATYVSVGTSATSTVTIPDHVADDLLLMFPYRGNSAGCTVPSGWTAITNPVSEQSFWLGAYYQRATGAGTSSGTWTSCAQLTAVVIRSTASSPFGTVSKSSDFGSSVLYPSNAYAVTDGTSISITAGCTRSNNSTFADAAPTGSTHRAGVAGTAGSCSVNSIAAGTGYDGATVSATNTRNAAFTIEIQGEGLGNPLTIQPLQPAGGPVGPLRAR